MTPRILLVDDDRIDRAAVRRALDEAAFACELVERDGADAALAAADESVFDGVLLDYRLPGATALELLPKLRQRLPGAAIIVLTGQGDERIAVELMKAGASDYLTKDRLDARVLGRTLRQALALADGRALLDRAERARLHYAATLRELVAAGPSLYEGDTIEERLGTAARVACRLAGGSEAFIGLRTPRASVALRASGDAWAPIGDGDGAWRARWDRSTLHEAPRDAAPALVVEQPLRAKDGSVGLIAVRRDVAAPELDEASSLLLAQIAVMASASVENLRLYDVARQAVESRDAVMAVVSHDLRSPLTAFGLGIEILRDDATAKTSAILDRMQSSAGHMKRLIDDLLDVARIESRDFIVEPAAESVAAMLGDARELMAPLADDAGLRLSIGPADVRVRADRHRVVQVLANLVGNAIRFTPRGGSIELRVEASAGEAEISVTDTGSGIDPANLPRVFGRYWRKDGRGLGLGLFIAKAIVDAHGGRIRVASRPGAGSTFAFTLPRA